MGQFLIDVSGAGADEGAESGSPIAFASAYALEISNNRKIGP
jgi:hypothetical protein